MGVCFYHGHVRFRIRSFVDQGDIEEKEKENDALVQHSLSSVFFSSSTESCCSRCHHMARPPSVMDDLI